MLPGAAAALLIGCTAPNPQYDGDRAPMSTDPDGGAGGPRSDASLRSHDAALPLDASLFGDGAAAGDAATPPECSAGSRKCKGLSSMGCEDGTYRVERVCPDESMCQQGFCQPPPNDTFGQGGRPCDTMGGPQQSSCVRLLEPTLSCQPFVDGATHAVLWRCASPVGQGAAGTGCAHGADCQSGFCASNGTCLQTCLYDGDCPTDGLPLKCLGVAATVEGVAISVQSCIPG
jgi:hypothetical protein